MPRDEREPQAEGGFPRQQRKTGRVQLREAAIAHEISDDHQPDYQRIGANTDEARCDPQHHRADRETQEKHLAVGDIPARDDGDEHSKPNDNNSPQGHCMHSG